MQIPPAIVPADNDVPRIERAIALTMHAVCGISLQPQASLGLLTQLHTVGPHLGFAVKQVVEVLNITI
jgi:hypothetical protein